MTKPAMFGLLCLAAGMTLFIALGNTWVMDSPSQWKLWRGMFMVALVCLVYSGLAIWISDPLPSSESPSISVPPPVRPPEPQDTELREPITFAAFSAMNRSRCESEKGFKHKLASWSTSDWFLATLGELGEAANIAKKLNRFRDEIPGNRESEDALRIKLRQELGDVFVYLDLLAQSLGFYIGEAAMEVFAAKSAEIGYVVQQEIARVQKERIT